MVGIEAMEDYSLRYAARSFRRWPAWILANTALGGISFLALEAIGAKLILDCGFANTAWAVLAITLIVFLTGLPIAYYSASYNVDIDLLTRGAGFGYIGSTITSLIYASFTFIFFSIEAVIMAQALELCLKLPLVTGYLISSLVIIPLVIYGITLINRIQLYTQPLWILLFVLPFVYILINDPGTLTRWSAFPGYSPSGASFDLLLFGSAWSLCFSIISQIGEQVDYLRFLPDKTKENRVAWWTALIFAGPGWILVGGLKMMCGAFLAFWAMSVYGLDLPQILEPVHLYLSGFSQLFHHSALALGVTAFFVVLSQVKINVTNAYAGSLAWSNFFSRLTHNHPGRVIWMIFNVLLAILMMHFGLVFTLGTVLAVYSNFAAAWIGAMVADLILLKPLGISPPYIEFRRAYLYSINPVGFGAMLTASTVSLACFFGAFGAYPKAFSAVIALCLSFCLALVIARATKGRYYIARPPEKIGSGNSNELALCSICEKSYEIQDMVYCPVYNELVCSLCCSLDILCQNACKKKDPSPVSPGLRKKRQQSSHGSVWAVSFLFQNFLVHFFSVAGVLAIIFVCFYLLFVSGQQIANGLVSFFVYLFLTVLLFWGIWVWWFALNQENRARAESKLDQYILDLEQEVTDRKQAEIRLLDSEDRLRHLNENLEVLVKERTQELKSSYRSLRQADKMASLGILVSGMAHEVNNPINFISLNSKLLKDVWQDILPALEEYEKTYGDLEIAGMSFDYARLSIPKLLAGISQGADRVSGIVHNLKDFSLQHSRNMKGQVDINKALEASLALMESVIKKSTNHFQVFMDPAVPLFRGDSRSIEQVMINLIQNACQALQTPDRGITVNTGTHNGQVIFSILDEGEGILPRMLKHVTDPFYTTKRGQGGTGLGLSISAGIVEEHQGVLKISSVPDQGTRVELRFPKMINDKEHSFSSGSKLHEETICEPKALDPGQGLNMTLRKKNNGKSSESF
ncbi:ATP-binding protein [Desulfotignum balticum]|uniref:ATP-binding protein n=1 Tax=Desulfotignum balticum TaxID=115781 RepID=UPI00042992C2|nr:ATP-binding protein [Desulfotignum balticum]